MSNTKNTPAAKFDKVLNNIARYFSYLSGIAILVMALLAFVNVIASKVFRSAIPGVNDWIDYMLIIVVYCCAADCQLNGGGLMHVDILFRLFPEIGKKLIKIIGNLLGIFVYAFAGYQTISLLVKNFTLHTLAQNSSTSFQIWPFILLYIVGTFFLAFALLWSDVRIPFLERPDDKLGPYDYDLKEMNVHGRVDTPVELPNDSATDETEGADGKETDV